MKRHLLSPVKTLAALAAFTLALTGAAFADHTSQHTEGKPGEKLGGAIGQGMKDENCAPKGCGKMHGCMSKTVVATQDGGVVVLCGNSLIKYDKNLKLVKEVQVECSCCAKKDSAAAQEGEMGHCERHKAMMDKGAEKKDEKKEEKKDEKKSP